MGQTIAEALKEEGRKEGAMRALQEMLLLQLQTKFGEVPVEIRRRIEQTDEVELLKTWLKAFAKARRRSQVGIPPLE